MQLPEPPGDDLITAGGIWNVTILNKLETYEKQGSAWIPSKSKQIFV